MGPESIKASPLLGTGHFTPSRRSSPLEFPVRRPGRGRLPHLCLGLGFRRGKGLPLPTACPPRGFRPRPRLRAYSSEGIHPIRASVSRSLSPNKGPSIFPLGPRLGSPLHRLTRLPEAPEAIVGLRPLRIGRFSRRASPVGTAGPCLLGLDILSPTPLSLPVLRAPAHRCLTNRKTMRGRGSRQQNRARGRSHLLGWEAT